MVKCVTLTNLKQQKCRFHCMSNFSEDDDQQLEYKSLSSYQHKNNFILMNIDVVEVERQCLHGIDN